MVDKASLPGKILMKFMNMKIVNKMILCYFLVFFIPVICLGILYYVNMLKDFQYKYVSNKQQVLEQSYNNFKSLSSQIEHIYPLLQYNNALVDYVTGFYNNASDEVYEYITQIDPLFINILIDNNLIDDIKIYRYQDTYINPGYYITNVREFKGDLQKISGSLNPYKCLWLMDEEGSSPPQIKYYMKLYDKKYLKDLGIIEILVNSRAFFQSFNISDTNEQLVFSQGGCYYLLNLDAPNILSGFTPESKMLQKIKNAQNTLALPELGGKLFLIDNSNVLPGKGMYLMLVFIILALILLSVAYYIIISSVLNRVIKLTRHIRNVDDRLVEYEGISFNDEIGVLIVSFNKMIRRISGLIRTVYEAELQKKEAEYNALQSQMKPHFLFNTLETIRMYAEVGKDTTTADMLCALGKFVRYNVSNNSRQTTLLNETEHVVNYFKIYKGRLGMNFEYSVDLPPQLEKYVCPKYILQPVAENCIVHGFKNVEHKKVIHIVIKEEENYITASIIDNGSGIVPQRLEKIRAMLENKGGAALEPEAKKGSIGLNNVNERLKMFYGPDFGVSIDNNPEEGATCVLKLDKLENTPG